ncbi:hypothetical protein ALO_21746 [Acetonema longum DSM 6540]|uniref:Uncharacterized protein n=1 Tax=Acetonema longum DSM 6540 TaxID=1009370 RepID=F7NQF0_9FIRM|nr:hypothetical protein ALO_21746 [Acetonema longum DSM 6540]
MKTGILSLWPGGVKALIGFGPGFDPAVWVRAMQGIRFKQEPACIHYFYGCRPVLYEEKQQAKQE